MRIESNLLALVCVHVEKAALRVVATLIELISSEFHVASKALEFNHAGE